MFGLGTQEMIILLTLGVLLFGKRLPEVGRSLGKSVMEFKNGLRGVEDELHGSIFRDDHRPAPPPRTPQRIAPTAPKFAEPFDPGESP
jgi:sec-independent protein translocase protein TatA